MVSLTVHCSVYLLLIPTKRTIFYIISWKRNTNTQYTQTKKINAFAHIMVNFGLLVMTVFTTFLDMKEMTMGPHYFTY